MGTKVRQLTKIFWHLTAPPSTSVFLGMVGLNPALSLVTLWLRDCVLETSLLLAEMRVHEHFKFQ